MGFNINFSPIASLVGAAQAAGQAQAAQRTQSLSAAQAQHQASLQASQAQQRVENAFRERALQQAAFTQQGEASYRERAMQLQEAASRRIDATPTSYQQMRDRMSIDLENRMTLRKEAQQEKTDLQAEELGALDSMRVQTGMSDQQYEEMKFGITAQASGAALLREFKDKTALSSAQQQKGALNRGAAIRKLDELTQRMNSPIVKNLERQQYAEQITRINREMDTSYPTPEGQSWRDLPTVFDETAKERPILAGLTVLPYRVGQTTEVGKFYWIDGPTGKIAAMATGNPNYPFKALDPNQPVFDPSGRPLTK